MEKEENIWKRKIFARQRKRRIEEEIIWRKKYLNCGGQEERRRKKKKIFGGDYKSTWGAKKGTKKEARERLAMKMIIHGFEKYEEEVKNK